MNQSPSYKTLGTCDQNLTKRKEDNISSIMWNASSLLRRLVRSQIGEMATSAFAIVQSHLGIQIPSEVQNRTIARFCGAKRPTMLSPISPPASDEVRQGELCCASPATCRPQSRARHIRGAALTLRNFGAGSASARLVT